MLFPFNCTTCLGHSNMKPDHIKSWRREIHFLILHNLFSIVPNFYHLRIMLYMFHPITGRLIWRLELIFYCLNIVQLDYMKQLATLSNYIILCVSPVTKYVNTASCRPVQVSVILNFKFIDNIFALSYTLLLSNICVWYHSEVFQIAK